MNDKMKPRKIASKIVHGALSLKPVVKMNDRRYLKQVVSGLKVRHTELSTKSSVDKEHLMDLYIRNDKYNAHNAELVDIVRRQDYKDFVKWQGDYFSARGIGRRDNDTYYVNRPDMRLIKSLCDVEMLGKENCAILDVGCGECELGIEIMRRGYSKGYRYSGLNLEKSRTEGIKKYGINVICDSIENYCSEGGYDIIICMHSLEHVLNLDKTMNNISRSLKDDGKFIVTVPYGRKIDCTSHVRIFYEDSLEYLCEKHGFIKRHLQKLPYLNNSLKNTIFYIGEKRADMENHEK